MLGSKIASVNRPRRRTWANRKRKEVLEQRKRCNRSHSCNALVRPIWSRDSYLFGFRTIDMLRVLLHTNEVASPVSSTDGCKHALFRQLTAICRWSEDHDVPFSISTSNTEQAIHTKLNSLQIVSSGNTKVRNMCVLTECSMPTIRSDSLEGQLPPSSDSVSSWEYLDPIEIHRFVFDMKPNDALSEATQNIY